MSLRLGFAVSAAAVLTLAGCGQKSTADAVAPAPGAPQATNPAPTGPAVTSADPNKTGSAYTAELERNPTQFEKQKEICHGVQAYYPPELQGPCSAWEAARAHLEEQQVDRDSKVQNTNSL